MKDAIIEHSFDMARRELNNVTKYVQLHPEEARRIDDMIYELRQMERNAIERARRGGELRNDERRGRLRTNHAH